MSSSDASLSERTCCTGSASLEVYLFAPRTSSTSRRTDGPTDGRLHNCDSRTELGHNHWVLSFLFYSGARPALVCSSDGPKMTEWPNNQKWLKTGKKWPNVYQKLDVSWVMTYDFIYFVGGSRVWESCHLPPWSITLRRSKGTRWDNLHLWDICETSVRQFTIASALLLRLNLIKETLFPGSLLQSSTGCTVLYCTEYSSSLLILAKLKVAPDAHHVISCLYPTL